MCACVCKRTSDPALNRRSLGMGPRLLLPWCLASILFIIIIIIIMGGIMGVGKARTGPF